MALQESLNAAVDMYLTLIRKEAIARHFKLGFVCHCHHIWIKKELLCFPQEYFLINEFLHQKGENFYERTGPFLK